MKTEYRLLFNFKIKRMKKFCLSPYRAVLVACAAIGAIALSSCSVKQYYQVATMQSPEVEMRNDGKFVYETADFDIYYDLWADQGSLTFAVYNKTDETLEIDLAKSSLIQNGVASYYGATKLEGDSRNLLRCYQYSTTDSFGNTSSHIPATLSLNANTIYIDEGNLLNWYNKEVYVNGEKESIVFVPAKAMIVISQFEISNTIYGECGLALDPSKKEILQRSFTESETPLRLENRLSVKVNGEVREVSNSFYVSQVTNVNWDNFYKKTQILNCDGYWSKTLLDAQYVSPNRYYIQYTPFDISSNRDGNYRSKTMTKGFNVKGKESVAQPVKRNDVERSRNVNVSEDGGYRRPGSGR